jgi:uncharacterized protein (DUF2252 family)
MGYQQGDRNIFFMNTPDHTKSSATADAIFSYNRGRDPKLLSLKYNLMAQNPFNFLRGTCHLFYQTLPDIPIFQKAPLAWCCGDLHFENLGSYKGDNRLVYFDINDFDEAALAPVTWDIVRLLTSLQCGAETLNVTHEETLSISQRCLEAYRNALIRGKSLWVERDTSEGLINELFTSLQERDRADFLDKRTTIKGGRRSLKFDGIKVKPTLDKQKESVTEFMVRFAEAQSKPKFFKVLDIGHRIAGTGSLGLERYVVLVEGKGSPDGNYLIDIKQALPSSLLPHLARHGIKQPTWADDANRIVSIQNQMQAVDHAFLHPVSLDGLPCILKELQPSADRVAICEWGKKLDRLAEVVCTMGRILAWDQLRASGRYGSASADKLIAFAKRDDWIGDMLDTATEMNQSNHRLWKDFAEQQG